jgi:hypothetical protein
MDHIGTLAPGRLSERLREGLRGHHLLFEAEAIREAFAQPDHVLSTRDADEVGRVLLAICREPLPVARHAVDGLDASARVSLIRLYFRLLQRAEEERGLRH